MADHDRMEQHAHEPGNTSPASAHQRLKRRGLIAGAAALVAGVLAKQAATPVSAVNGDYFLVGNTVFYSGGQQSTAPTSLAAAVTGNPGFAVANNFTTGTDAYPDGLQGYSGGTNAANAAGVFGRNNVLNGIGVAGAAPSGLGVFGGSTNGSGVAGNSNSGAGVYGQSSAYGSSGVYGYSTGGVGVQGVSTVTNGIMGTASVAYGAGVLGQSATNQGIGIYGIGTNGATAGSFSGEVLVTGPAAGNAIDSTCNGPYGGAVVGRSNALGSVAIYGINGAQGAYAGYFVGPLTVNGPLVATGGKNAAVMHPDGTHRLLYCVESPESWFEDFGEATLSGGRAIITLDPDFVAVVHSDQYHIFLTGYSDSNGLYLTNRSAKGFTVQEYRGGTSNGGFSYRVVAKRKDIKGERLAKYESPKVANAPPPPPKIAIPPVPTPPHLPPPRK